MRPFSIVGLILIVLGVIALAVRSVTYFTTDHVTGPLGFFAWEVERPHTIFINPLAGIVAVAIGIALVLMSRSKGVRS
jgi:membrane-bound ClpP family serine protease